VELVDGWEEEVEVEKVVLLREERGTEGKGQGSFTIRFRFAFFPGVLKDIKS